MGVETVELTDDQWEALREIGGRDGIYTEGRDFSNLSQIAVNECNYLNRAGLIEVYYGWFRASDAGRKALDDRAARAAASATTATIRDVLGINSLLILYRANDAYNADSFGNFPAKGWRAVHRLVDFVAFNSEGEARVAQLVTDGYLERGTRGKTMVFRILPKGRAHLKVVSEGSAEFDDQLPSAADLAAMTAERDELQADLVKYRSIEADAVQAWETHDRMLSERNAATRELSALRDALAYSRDELDAAYNLLRYAIAHYAPEGEARGFMPATNATHDHDAPRELDAAYAMIGFMAAHYVPEGDMKS